MKRVLLLIAAFVALVAEASAQEPVKKHDWAFIGLEVGPNYTFWSVSDNPYHKISPQPGIVGSMHVEFLFGRRQQSGINLNVGVEWLRASVQEVDNGPTHRVQAMDVFFALGYKYTFRNAFFLEIRPQFDMYASCKRTLNGTTEAKHDPKAKTPMGFSIGAGVGYNFTDNFALFFRYKRGFGDVFNTEGVMPVACKETSNVIEMGVTIGLTL